MTSTIQHFLVQLVVYFFKVEKSLRDFAVIYFSTFLEKLIFVSNLVSGFLLLLTLLCITYIMFHFYQVQGENVQSLECNEVSHKLVEMVVLFLQFV